MFLGVGVVGVVLTGLWAQSTTNVDTNLFKVVTGLPNSFEGVARALAALGSIWCVGLVVIVLLLARWLPAARDAAIAGVGAWLASVGLNALLGTRSAASLGITVRTGSGPAFPAATVAVAAGLTVVLSPYLTRPVRRVLLLVAALVALSAMYLGTGLASDVAGGLLLGLAAGAAVHVAFGAPGGRPSLGEVREALGELGFAVASIGHADEQVTRATVMDVVLTSGEHLRVDAFGRDQRDGQIAAKVWHKAMYHEPGVPVFGSRLQQVEHIAYALLLADRAGVSAPRPVKTGVAGPDAAMLVSSAPTGRPLDDLPSEQVTDALLATAWAQVEQLHAAGLSHGNLDAHRIRVADDGTVSLEDFSAADATAGVFQINRDRAALVVDTALIVGNDRAVSAARVTLGPERLAEIVPLVQPAALPRATTRGTKHLAKQLKALRAVLATAADVEAPAPLKIRRLSLVNIGITVGVVFALALAFHGLSNVNFASLSTEFSHAVWGWAVLGAMVYPLIPLAWATAITGAVNVDLPFVPTVLMQLGATFLSLITPNGIGGNALQIDYLHHEDATVAAATSAVVLNVATGGLLQLVLLFVAATLTASTLNFSHGGTATLGIIALVAAAIGVVMLVPKIRGKVVPALQQAFANFWAVVRNPHKAIKLLGGNLVALLLYPAILGLCLLAFGQSLGYAQLIVVQLGAGLLAAAAPVPGGIGVQEAALTAGLAGFGVPTNPALAAVIVYRGITFAIPPIFGYFSVRWLRHQGLA